MAWSHADAEAEMAAVDRVRRGCISGLEELVRLHQSSALKAACAITHDQTAAEDVVAEAFLRAYERIDRFDPDRPFRPWFLRIVMNLAIKEASRSRLLDRLRAHRAGAQAEPLDPAAAAERADVARLVRAESLRLSPQLRAVLVLHYFLEMDVAETAAILGCPVGTVKRRLHDARRKLYAPLAKGLAEASLPLEEMM